MHPLPLRLTPPITGGLGLPNVVPGVSGQTLLEWARDGEQAGFTGLATTDWLVFDSHESMTMLAAVEVSRSGAG